MPGTVAYGTALDRSDTITFRVSSNSLALASVTVTARSFRAAEVALPALSAGRHEIRVVATVGSGDGARRDELVRTSTVVSRRAVQAAVPGSPSTARWRCPPATGSPG